MRRINWRTLVSLSVTFGVWEVLSQFVLNPRLVPPPSWVFLTYGEMVASLELLEDVWASLQRILIGYAMGASAGLLAGTLMGRIRFIRDLLEPPLGLVRSIPPIGLVPLAMIWFGIGELVKYTVIMYATLIIVTLSTAEGVRNVPPIQLRAARCLGAGRLRLFTHVILPSALPFILNGMRVALGFAFMGVISAELIAANDGIGYLITQARSYIQTSKLFVGLLTLGVLAALTDRAFRLLLARAFGRFSLERAAQR